MLYLIIVTYHYNYMKYPVYIIDQFTKIILKKKMNNDNVAIYFTFENQNDKITNLLQKKELHSINYLINKYNIKNPEINTFFENNNNYILKDEKITNVNGPILKTLAVKSSLDPLNKNILCNNKKVSLTDLTNMTKMDKVKLHMSIDCYATYNKEKNIIYTRCKLLNIKIIESKIDAILDDSTKYKQFNKPYYPNRFIKKNPLINSITQNILNILNNENTIKS